MKRKTKSVPPAIVDVDDVAQRRADAFMRRVMVRSETPRLRKERIAALFEAAGYRVKSVELEKIHPLWKVVMYVAEPIRAAWHEEVEERIRGIIAELSRDIEAEGSPVLIDGKRIQAWFTWRCPHCMGFN